jgi:hypothetical protein
MEFSKQKMMLILTTLLNVITQAVTVYESDRIAETDTSKLDKEIRENPGSGEKNRKPSAVGAATKKGSLKLTRKQRLYEGHGDLDPRHSDALRRGRELEQIHRGDAQHYLQDLYRDQQFS